MMRERLAPLSVALLLLGALGPSATVAQQPSPDWPRLESEAVALLSRYLQIDTTNPPGNETPAAEFFRRIFDAEGIEARVLESSPGRGSVWARLSGDGSKPAVVLLNHLDVVPADPRFWSQPPFGGILHDGYVWGRGALDMKGMGIIELMAMLILKRERVPLSGDVIFLGTADEEAGGRRGAGFIVDQHWDLIRGAGVVINEGGAIGVQNGQPLFFGVSRSEKVPLGLKLVATGTPGHGSAPRADSSVNRLVAALNRIITHQTPIKVLPEVQSFYAGIADTQPSPTREWFRDLPAAFRDPTAADALMRNLTLNARVRNTISVTMLQGSDKVNVIPPEATARLDVRLLPGEDPQAFLDEIRRVVADDSIKVESARPFDGGSSPAVHELLQVIGDLAVTIHPHARLTPQLLTGATDCRYFRVRGIPCYGFLPFKLTARDFDGFHGNNERLSVENVHFGVRLLHEIVRRLATN
jgi:acetylornithine deacetylase/succinyl-diaminopimelate desuccinylase-like protein